MLFVGRRGFICAALLQSVCAIGHAAAAETCDPAKAAQNYPSLAGKVLKIGVDPQTPPYVTRDPEDFSKVTGFDADLARAVFECAGLKTEFFIGGWSGLLPALIADRIDVFWDDLYYTPKRAEEVDYITYMQAGTGALGPVGNPKNIKGMTDLCGSTVAVGLGAVEEAQAKTQSDSCVAAGKPPIATMTFPDVAAGVRLVQGGRADVMLYDLALIDKLVKDQPTVFVRDFSVLSGFGIGVAVKKGNNELVKAVYDNLSIIQKTGKEEAIFKTYTIDPALGLPAEIKTK